MMSNNYCPRGMCGRITTQVGFTAESLSMWIDDDHDDVDNTYMEGDNLDKHKDKHKHYPNLKRLSDPPYTGFFTQPASWSVESISCNVSAYMFVQEAKNVFSPVDLRLLVKDCVPKITQLRKSFWGKGG